MLMVRACRLDERPENSPLPARVKQVFGVPLDTEGERVAHPLDRLDHARLVARRDSEAVSERVHCVGVKRIYPHLFRTGVTGKMGARNDDQGAPWKDGPDLLRIRMRRPGILVKCSAKCDVQHLRAPADAEYGQTSLERLFGEGSLEGVAFGVQPGCELQVTTVERGRDIVATADDKTVHIGEVG